MHIKGIFIFIHFPPNTGYAIGKLEEVFYEMAFNLTKNNSKIHFGYTSLLDKAPPNSLPPGFSNVVEFDSSWDDNKKFDTIYNYIIDNNIDVAFGFDQPVFLPSYAVLRKAGIKLFVSYYGSPISSINSGIKLLAKRIEVMFRKYKPDQFVFESNSCARSAIYGRGISSNRVSVIPLGIDENKYKPTEVSCFYAHQTFNIPTDRKIIIFSGHINENKGIRVIINAANELINNRKRTDVHFLLLGNKNREETPFATMCSQLSVADYVTFGGYRIDTPDIYSSCYAGVLPSTKYESFGYSSLEIASSGIPIIASRLQGIIDSVADNETGFLIEPGNYLELADRIELLLNNDSIRRDMGIAARQRILDKFTRSKQVANLTNLLSDLYEQVSR